jgi:hypothetical protein
MLCKSLEKVALVWLILCTGLRIRLKKSEGMYQPALKQDPLDAIYKQYPFKLE